MTFEAEEIRRALMFIQAASRDAKKSADKALEVVSKPLTRITKNDVQLRMSAMNEAGWMQSRSAAYDNAAVILEEAMNKASKP